MKQLSRLLFNLAAAISLLLFVVTVVLWVRSERPVKSQAERDHIDFTRSDPVWWIISQPGKAVLCRQTGHDWSGVRLAGFDVMGFSFGGQRGTAGELIWNLAVPYWMICLALLVIPLIELWRRWRKRKGRLREEQGLCPVCGYDLRATPDRCPECGTISKDERQVVP